MPLDNTLQDPVSQAIAVLQSMGMGQPDPVQAAAQEAASGGVPVLGSSAGPEPVVPPPAPSDQLGYPGFENTLIAGPNPDRADVPVPPEAMQPGYAAEVQETREPVDPYSQPPTKPLGALEQATAEEEAQLRRKDAAAASAIDWEAAAKADEAEQTAKLHESTAIKHQQNFEERERRDAALNAHHDAENAANLTQLMDMVKKEPNPGRYWENMSNFGKAMWALSMFSDAMRVNFGAPGAQAVTLEMYKQAVAADVAAQRARLDSEVAVKKLQMVGTKEKQARNLSDSKDRYSQEILRISSLEQAAAVRITKPNDLDAEAKKAAQMMQTQQDKLKLIQDRSDHTRKASLQDSAQRFSAGQASIQRKADIEAARVLREHQIKMENLKAVNDLMAKPVSIGAGVNPLNPRNPLDKDGQPTYREVTSGVGTGLVYKDKKGGLANGDGRIMFRKEDAKQANETDELVANANSRYTMMKDLLDELEHGQGGFRYAVHGTNSPKINGLIKALGMEVAKAQNGGRPTDKDFSVAVGQVLGYDPDGKWLERGKFGLGLDEVKDKLREGLAAMPAKVNNDLRTIPQDINGQGTAVWDPKYLTPTKPPVRTQSEIQGKTPAALPVGITEAGYRKAQAEHFDSPERQTLPDHDESVIDSVIALGKSLDDNGKVRKAFRSPSDIATEASRILGPIEERIKELTDKAGDPRDPWAMPQPLTADESAEMLRLNNTRTLAQGVASDESRQAQAALDKFEKWLTSEEAGFTVKQETAQKMARKKFGLRAPKEVDEIISKHRGEHGGF